MKWSLAIFSSREKSDILARSIVTALESVNGQEVTIDIIINGNPHLASECGRFIRILKHNASCATINVWHISLADKANAWNQYVHRIWAGSDIAFFSDGYVQMKSDALDNISNAFISSPESLAVSGIATRGRSAQFLRNAAAQHGGIHGNLFAVRGDVLSRLRALEFRLPLGLYRTDGVLGAVICFGLDPTANSWDPKRILVEPRATWSFRPLRWYSIGDVRAHLKRMMRQAQGVLENLAIREHLAIERKSPQSLPQTAAVLVNSWIDAFPRRAFKTFMKMPLTLIAARKLRYFQRDWSQTAGPPLLIAQSCFTSTTNGRRA